MIIVLLPGMFLAWIASARARRSSTRAASSAFAFRNYNGIFWSFSTLSSFSVPGLSGPNEDIFVCFDGIVTGSETSCPAFSRLFEGDSQGIAGNISGLELPIQGFQHE